MLNLILQPRQRNSHSLMGGSHYRCHASAARPSKTRSGFQRLERSSDLDHTVSSNSNDSPKRGQGGSDDRIHSSGERHKHSRTSMKDRQGSSSSSLLSFCKPSVSSNSSKASTRLSMLNRRAASTKTLFSKQKSQSRGLKYADSDVIASLWTSHSRLPLNTPGACATSSSSCRQPRHSQRITRREHLAKSMSVPDRTIKDDNKHDNLRQHESTRELGVKDKGSRSHSVRGHCEPYYCEEYSPTRDKSPPIREPVCVASIQEQRDFALRKFVPRDNENLTPLTSTSTHDKQEFNPIGMIIEVPRNFVGSALDIPLPVHSAIIDC